METRIAFLSRFAREDGSVLPAVPAPKWQPRLILTLRTAHCALIRNYMVVLYSTTYNGKGRTEEEEEEERRR